MPDGIEDVTFPSAFMDSLNDRDDADTGNLDTDESADSGLPEQSASAQTAEGSVSVDELMARAEASGLYDARELKELKAGYLRQADYTKKTQEVAESRAQIGQFVEELQFLRGKFKAEQNSGTKATEQAINKAQSRVDEVLSRLPDDDDDPNVANMRALLKDLAEAAKADVKAESEASIAPVKLKAAQDAFVSEMQSHYSGMRQKYGEGIDQVWPDLVKSTLHLRTQGERATPESVLALYAPEKAIELLQSAKQTQTKTKTRSTASPSMEGMERVRYRKQVESDDDVPTTQRDVDTGPTATAERVMQMLANGRNASHFKAGLSRL